MEGIHGPCVCLNRADTISVHARQGMSQLTSPTPYQHCVLEFGALSMREVKIFFHCSFDLYLYWVVYVLIFKSSS